MEHLMNRNKPRLGREAIETLKRAYRDGTQLDGVYAVRQYVIDVLGIKPSKISIETARNWDRTARLENADGEYANTSPSARNGYRRNPNATAIEREASHHSALRYVSTRTTNELRIAKAAAAQNDATRKEIERCARLEIAVPILKILVDLDTANSEIAYNDLRIVTRSGLISSKV